MGVATTVRDVAAELLEIATSALRRFGAGSVLTTGNGPKEVFMDGS